MPYCRQSSSATPQWRKTSLQRSRYSTSSRRHARWGGQPSRATCRKGLRLLRNVRLRVEVLDTDGTAVEEAFGWVFGDLTPGGGYFVVPAQTRERPTE